MSDIHQCTFYLDIGG